MQVVQVLNTVLMLQSQAILFGADVKSELTQTQQALSAELLRIPRFIAPDVRDKIDVPEERPPSAFDPEHHDVHIQATRCRAFLLEVVRRAVHDWVLYRGTRKIQERGYARDAYVWLFEEEPGHPNWELRHREGDSLMAFLTICEMVDLDPETVRSRARRMTMREIMTAGRPAETRKIQSEGVEDYSAPAGLEDLLDDGSTTTYEAHFAVHTC